MNWENKALNAAGIQKQNREKAEKQRKDMELRIAELYPRIVNVCTKLAKIMGWTLEIHDSPINSYPSVELHSDNRDMTVGFDRSPTELKISISHSVGCVFGTEKLPSDPFTEDILAEAILAGAGF